MIVRYRLSKEHELEDEMYKVLKETDKELKTGKTAKNKQKKTKMSWLCQEKFKLDNIKVWDQSHSTEKYTGVADQSSNSNVRRLQSSFVPALFHNFSQYDDQFFIKTFLGKCLFLLNLSHCLLLLEALFQ